MTTEYLVHTNHRQTHAHKQHHTHTLRTHARTYTTIVKGEDLKLKFVHLLKRVTLHA